MKLNKYQKAWIKRLMSGKTKKCKGELFGPNGSSCCLGVAVKINNLSNGDADVLDKANVELLKLRTDEGAINSTNISAKWRKKLTVYMSKSHFLSLAGLNDKCRLSHKTIGQFINENRKAVFYE